MNSSRYQRPSTPPPSYSSVVNDPSTYQIYSQANQQQRPSEFDQFINRYESEFIIIADCQSEIEGIILVNPSFSTRLYALKGYEIVFICDDSGSMTAPIGKSSYRFSYSFSVYSMIFVGEMNNPYQTQRTRCEISFHPLAIDLCLLFVGDELKKIVSIVVDLAAILDPDGVDVYFLNREPMLHVRHSSELETVFAMDPEGRLYLHYFC